MADRFDICIARPKKDGTVYWHKIGVAFSSDRGGFDLSFDSLPIPEYSDQYGLQVRAKAFPAKPREESQHGRDKANGYARESGRTTVPRDEARQGPPELDDEIPF